MTTSQTNTQTPKNKSTKKQQSFPNVEIGTPQVPVRKGKKVTPAPELLVDWEHAS